MEREKFKPGAKRPKIISIEDELNDDLFSGKGALKIQDRFDENEENKKPITKSLHARDIELSLLESIKDIVYTERMNNNLQASQGTIITEALKLFIQNYNKEILPRPEWVKEQEKRKSKKKQMTSMI